jgi:hypothetical protein
VLQLRQLDLQFALEAARTLRENIENQAAAIQYPPPRQLLEVAFLTRCQSVINEYNFSLIGNGDVAQFLRLAAPHEEARIGAVTTAGYRCNRDRARGSRERPEFLEVFSVDRCSQPEAHEHRALTRTGALEALHELAARL